MAPRPPPTERAGRLGIDRSGRPEAELTAPAELPEAIGHYLTELTGRLAAAFDGQLLGVYLTGSAALRAFAPDDSDLDVAAICADTASLAQRQEVVGLVRHDALPCPARGLELLVYPWSTAQGAAAAPGFVLELNDGPRMPFSAALCPCDRPAGAADFWYVLDRSILRAVGRPLHGPPVIDLVVEPARRDVLDALVSSLAWHRAAGPHERRNAVLNACRGLRWVTDGVWSSKPDAGRWALTHCGEQPRTPRRRARRGFGDSTCAAGGMTEVQAAVRRAAAT